MAGREVIAVDLGGTNIRVGVVSDDGDLRQHSRAATQADQGPYAVIDRMADLIVATAAEAGIAADAPVGVASPGPLNPRTGTVLYTPNLPDWRDVPLVSILEDTSLASMGVYLIEAIVINGDLTDPATGLGARNTSILPSDTIYLLYNFDLDEDDFEAAVDQFAASLNGTGADVPEPAAIVMPVISAGALASRRRASCARSH